MLLQIYRNYSQSFIIYGKLFKQIASAAFPAVASLKAQCVEILRIHRNILEMNVLCHSKMKWLNQCASSWLSQIWELCASLLTLRCLSFTRREFEVATGSP